MKQLFSLKIVLPLLLLFFFSQLFGQEPIFNSIKSGNWNEDKDPNSYIWDKDNGVGWNGSYNAISGPSQYNDVVINTGHVVTISGDSWFKNLTIRAGASLTCTSVSPSTLLAGLEQFSTIAVPYLITNDGTLGTSTKGAADNTILGIGYNCNAVTLTGGGKTNIFGVIPQVLSYVTYLRPMNFTFDQDITVSGPFTSYVNSNNNKSDDDITYTINAGKTVQVDGYFHANAPTTINLGGKYTYNINGNLDLSGSITPSFIPSIAGSVTTLNIKGLLKLGSPGLGIGAGNIVNVNGGTVDATAVTGPITAAAPFITSGAGALKRLVGASEVNFPVATTNTGYSPVVLNNSGVQDNFTVSVQDGFSTPVLPATIKKVNKQWTITEGTSGGSSVIVKLGWLTADQEAGFVLNDPLNPVGIIHYNGSTWEYIPATVTGSGTVADPYIATSSIPVVAFSPFGVGNGIILPVTFVNVKAYQKNTGIQVEWTSSSDINVSKYIVEKSGNGAVFTDAGSVTATGNSAVAKTYSWYDGLPGTGDNFYRIKAIDKDGKIRYTDIMKVAIGKGKSYIVISPNPVTSRQLNLQLNNFLKGVYALSIFNMAGQKIMTQQISHPGGSSSELLQLPSGMKGGRYNLRINSKVINITRGMIYVN